MNNSSSAFFLLKRRQGILKAVALVSLFLGSVSLIVDFLNLLGIMKTQPDLSMKLFFLVVALLSTSASIAAYVLARRGQPGNVRAGAYIITITWTVILFGISLAFPNEIGFLIPMLCVGLLFSAREIVGWLVSFIGLTLICTLAGSFSLITTNAPNGASLAGQLIPSLLTLILTGGSFWYLQNNVKVVLGEVNKRIEDLEQYSQDRQQRRQLGLQVVQNMRQQATELSGVSLQQESGANEQATAVTEVTLIMEQLGSSARFVATNSRKAAEMAERTRTSAESVKAAAEKASDTTLEGLVTTGEAGEAILRVQQQIRTLEERLEQLVGQSSQISKIVDLMRELGDQTHLLALNAAIESAGAGQYGERFGVVADEVKRLADRSLLATREVRQMILQLQQAVTEANSVAVEAHHESEEAAEKADRSGAVINELGRVIEINSLRAHEILQETLEVSTLMNEIADITGDQRATTEQITDTMQAIGEVARENAQITSQLNQTAARLEVLSSELTTALVERERARVEAQLLLAA